MEYPRGQEVGKWADSRSGSRISVCLGPSTLGQEEESKVAVVAETGFHKQKRQILPQIGLALLGGGGTQWQDRV